MTVRKRVKTIFVSYRKLDSAGWVIRLVDDLSRAFGEKSVFHDVQMDPGTDWPKEISTRLEKSDAVLVVIGPHWASIADPMGQPRIKDPEDRVRYEVSAALKLGLRVVPVLVGNAQLPPVDSLPKDLQPLLDRQTAELRDARWKDDAEYLITRLRPPSTKWSAIAAFTGLALALMVGLFNSYSLVPEGGPDPLESNPATLETGRSSTGKDLDLSIREAVIAPTGVEAVNDPAGSATTGEDSAIASFQDKWNIVYYRKEADSGIIDKLLTSAGIQYQIGQSSVHPQWIKSNAIVCHPESSVDGVKFLARLLIEGGVAVQAIAQFQTAGKPQSRLEIVANASKYQDGTSVPLNSKPLTVSEVNSLTKCPVFMRN